MGKIVKGRVLSVDVVEGDAVSTWANDVILSGSQHLLLTMEFTDGSVGERFVTVPKNKNSIKAGHVLRAEERSLDQDHPLANFRELFMFANLGHIGLVKDPEPLVRDGQRVTGVVVSQTGSCYASDVFYYNHMMRLDNGDEVEVSVSDRPLPIGERITATILIVGAPSIYTAPPLLSNISKAPIDEPSVDNQRIVPDSFTTRMTSAFGNLFRLNQS